MMDRGHCSWLSASRQEGDLAFSRTLYKHAHMPVGAKRVALLHTALVAVRDAIAAQQRHLGSGGEQPLD